MEGLWGKSALLGTWMIFCWSGRGSWVKDADSWAGDWGWLNQRCFFLNFQPTYLEKTTLIGESILKIWGVFTVVETKQQVGNSKVPEAANGEKKQVQPKELEVFMNSKAGWSTFQGEHNLTRPNYPPFFLNSRLASALDLMHTCSAAGKFVNDFSVPKISGWVVCEWFLQLTFSDISGPGMMKYYIPYELRSVRGCVCWTQLLHNLPTQRHKLQLNPSWWNLSLVPGKKSYLINNPRYMYIYIWIKGYIHINIRDSTSPSFLCEICWGMLIIALDYDYAPSSELTCTRDARTMYRMAGRAGVDDITIITDKVPFFFCCFFSVFIFVRLLWNRVFLDGFG